MTIQELLSEVRARRLILTWSRSGRITLWGGCTPIPCDLRQAVAAHNRDLQWLISRSGICVCTNPDLHRAYWSYQLKRYCCDACARLLSEVS